MEPANTETRFEKRVSGRLFDKVWDRHLVVSPEGEPPLLYIDLHLVHEVTSPQAFEGLELAGRGCGGRT